MNPPLMLCLLSFVVLLSASPALPQGYAADPEKAVATALSSGKPLLLAFGAPWCASCGLVAPAIAALASESSVSAGIDIVSVDIDRAPALAERYGITSIPVQVFLDAAGREAYRHFGVIEGPELLRALRRSIPLR